MKRQMSNQARAAAAIRKELKTAFPKTKFSVTSESFSMGDAVRINWTDGPTTTAVEAISKKYQYGHFDGMVDMYEYSNTRDDIPQAKFVQTTRYISDEARDAIIKAHNERFCESGQIKNIEAYNEDAGCWNSTVVYRYFHKTSYEVTE